MDRIHSNLSRPPPKLRYFSSHERSATDRKAKHVRNIEECFDELDSSPNPGSELSVLSPLPKTWMLSGEAEMVNTPNPVQSKPEKNNSSPDQQELTVNLIPEMGTSESPLQIEETPSEEPVSRKTSCPAGLVADDYVLPGEENHRASPLLFEIEAAVQQEDVGKSPQSNQKLQLTRKDIEESSEDEFDSPPRKFDLGKGLGDLNCKMQDQRKAPCSLSSDEEFLSLKNKKVDVAPDVLSEKRQASEEMRETAPRVDEGKPSAAAPKLKVHPQLEGKDHRHTVVPGVKSLQERRESSAFLLKLKDGGQSKTAFRKEKAPSPVQVSPHLEIDEEFLILEGEDLRSPPWFSIPRRTGVKQSKLPEQDRRELVPSNNEAGTAESAANDNTSPNARGKQHSNKDTGLKKTKELNTADKTKKGKRVKDSEKRLLNVLAAVQSEAKQNCLDRREKVAKPRERQTAYTVDGDGDTPLPLPSACVESSNGVQGADKKYKTSKVEKISRHSKKTGNNAANHKRIEENTSHNIHGNDSPLEVHEVGKRKRKVPGSWWLLNQEEEMDVFNNNVAHKSTGKRTKKPSKSQGSPGTIPATIVRQEVTEEADGRRRKLASSQSAGKKIQVSKKKSKAGRTRHPQKIKGTESEAPDLPEVLEEERVDEGGESHRYSNPSPCYPEERHAPTPDKNQKQKKEKKMNQYQQKRSKNPANHERIEENTSHNIHGNDSPLEGHEVGKRKRKVPGSWWLLNQEEEMDVFNNNVAHKSTGKRTKKPSKSQGSPGTIPATIVRQEVTEEADGRRRKLASSQSAGKKSQVSKKKSKAGRTRHPQKIKGTESEAPDLPEVLEEERVDEGGESHRYSNPSPCYPEERHAPTPGRESERSFDHFYTPQNQRGRHDNKRKLSALQRPQNYAKSPLPDNQLAVFVDSTPLLNRRHKTSMRSTPSLLKPQEELVSSLRASRKRADMLSSVKPRKKFLQSCMKRKVPEPRNIKASLTAFGDIFTPVSTRTTRPARRSESRQPVGFPRKAPPSRGDRYVSPSVISPIIDDYQHDGEYPTGDPNAKSVSEDFVADPCSNFCSAEAHRSARLGEGSMNRGMMHQFNELQSEVDVFEGFDSGPSSMIEVGDLDEHNLPSCQNAPRVLLESQMCFLPLRPTVLLAEDRESLIEWFKNVWPAPAQTGAQIITPEDFQWYAYRGRAMGYMTDLLCETFSNGKILLGSYMKKPLQVDNNAVSVYNILTSLVRVSINGVVRDLSPGETFVVPCGHEYGMCNLTPEPAVLLYHRMVSGRCDIIKNS
ncbi:uncharacterized protein si:ch211-161h7.4 [Megalops cyprinoides]|uniref:uncharacterized protein si:ch211-161h7.4 n=1 Tax=Megalops cyprinoides TaxID=118141 RepID=UPI00186521BC|nr:uncharacterized protein si:ch211-161h7.4 [Megalops cyprinoides]